MNKKAQAEFAWIFAVIVGAVILFLTFFFIGRQFFVQETKTTTELTRGLDLLLAPFSYLGAIAEFSTNEITLNDKTSLSFDCSSENLGYSVLTVNAKEQSASNEIYDKYIFARDMDTRKIIALSKPFEMPFRVADVMILIPEDNYCIVNAPSEVENELHDMNLTGFSFYNSLSSCDEDDITICFGSISCDVKIMDKCGSKCEYDYGQVFRGSEKMYYSGRALLYSAMFSSQGVYNCNVQRLMTRLNLLVKIYKNKDYELAQQDCDENYGDYLNVLSSAATLVKTNTVNVAQLYIAAKSIDDLNDRANCGLY